jgi:hypothetical protein
MILSSKMGLLNLNTINPSVKTLGYCHTPAASSLPTTSGNDNVPSSVPRAASRISFESMPKDEKFSARIEEKNSFSALGSNGI